MVKFYQIVLVIFISVFSLEVIASTFGAPKALYVSYYIGIMSRVLNDLYLFVGYYIAKISIALYDILSTHIKTACVNLWNAIMPAIRLWDVLVEYYRVICEYVFEVYGKIDGRVIFIISLTFIAGVLIHWLLYTYFNRYRVFVDTLWDKIVTHNNDLNEPHPENDAEGTDEPVRTRRRNKSRE